MENINTVLNQNILFKNFSNEEINIFLKENNSYTKIFNKGNSIFIAGDIVKEMCIIIYGKVAIEHYNETGDKIIFTILEKGEHFADTYALIQSPVMVNARALEKTQLLFLNVSTLTNYNKISYLNGKILCNLLKILANKNMTLSRKIRNTSHKTIKNKLLSYLNEEALIAKSNEFKIPYNRQELADYLNCNRSQLSKELSKLKKDKIIYYYRNYFKILK